MRFYIGQKVRLRQPNSYLVQTGTENDDIIYTIKELSGQSGVLLEEWPAIFLPEAAIVAFDPIDIMLEVIKC